MQGRFSRMSLACPTAHLATRGGQKLPTPLPQDSPLTARRETRSSKTMCLAYTLQRKVAQSPTVTSRLCEAIASCHWHACRIICRLTIKHDPERRAGLDIGSKKLTADCSTHKRPSDIKSDTGAVNWVEGRFDFTIVESISETMRNAFYSLTADRSTTELRWIFSLAVAECISCPCHLWRQVLLCA